MISIVYSTRKHNPQFQQHIKETIGIKEFEILEFINNGEKSLTQVYNEGLEKSKYDLVVFSHDDIILKKDESWGKKIIKHFTETDYGILGKAGTTDLPEIGRWWEDTSKMVGIVSHSSNGSTWENKYSSSFGKEIIETIMLDGLFFSIHKKRIKQKFDENIKGFHFYDVDFSFNNHLNGVKVGVMFDFKITHKSIGMTNDEWEKNRLEFVEKYKDKLPYRLNPNIRVEHKEVKLRQKPKLGVIIPTKGNLHLLKQCVSSIFEMDDYENLIIYIADTGSTDEEKNEIKLFISKWNNIKFIEYDFYNFAIINNDVVEKHVDKDTEILLFCNNDIKLLNNSITRMVDVYNKNRKNIGTIGCRLHFDDNTIQHSGIMMWVSAPNQSNKINIHLSHYGLRSYYKYHPESFKNILGNTAAFMLINKNLFQQIGGFNTTYKECFEDVELNMKCILFGKENYFVGNGVCYHYESQTRNKSEDKLMNEIEDYNQRLIPFIINNKKIYNYFDNIKADQFKNIIEQTIKKQTNEVRSFV
jgi:GT2 family glycosyltransferase